MSCEVVLRGDCLAVILVLCHSPCVLVIVLSFSCNPFILQQSGSHCCCCWCLSLYNTEIFQYVSFYFTFFFKNVRSICFKHLQVLSQFQGPFGWPQPELVQASYLQWQPQLEECSVHPDLTCAVEFTCYGKKLCVGNVFLKQIKELARVIIVPASRDLLSAGCEVLFQMGTVGSEQ